MGDGAVAVAALKRGGNYIKELADYGLGVINVRNYSAKDGKENNGPMETPLDAKDGQDYQS